MRRVKGLRCWAIRVSWRCVRLFKPAPKAGVGFINCGKFQGSFLQNHPTETNPKDAENSTLQLDTLMVGLRKSGIDSWFHQNACIPNRHDLAKKFPDSCPHACNTCRSHCMERVAGLRRRLPSRTQCLLLDSHPFLQAFAGNSFGVAETFAQRVHLGIQLGKKPIDFLQNVLTHELLEAIG